MCYSQHRSAILSKPQQPSVLKLHPAHKDWGARRVGWVRLSPLEDSIVHQASITKVLGHTIKLLITSQKSLYN